LNQMGQVVAVLYALGEQMSRFQGHMASTRSAIKSCRTLAADLQEEIDVRRGNPGNR
jgi:prefoldin subunit 5